MLIEIILLVIFVVFFLVGFFLIYRQVALVKKGEFSNKDRIQCVIYGILFGIAIMVVVAMGFIFAIDSVHPLLLLLPFSACLIYISFYPLIDFIFIALSKESDEGLTPFHKLIGNRIINISENKIKSLFMAIILYLFIIIPPILLFLAGLPFIVLWVSWTLAYPLTIIVHYGTKGYIAGISNEFYHIPDIKRSIFLNFEDSKRGMKQFSSNPKPYIILGFMLFVFIWAWISMIQTFVFFFTRSLAISTMSSYFVYVTLFFGIIGYFTRFWGRKIKYRGIDIYFAAYLMAAIGINVFVNFILVNIDRLSNSFDYWSITREIVPNYLMFTWAALIEEITLIIFTSYFFLSKKSEFKYNIKYSKISECGQKFDSIPLFTFIKDSNPKIRKHAEDTILLMFERIPLKEEIDLNDWKYKNLLLDGICDYNSNSRRICNQILTQLEKDVPNITIPWIIEALESPNYDKIIPILRSLFNADINIIDKIPKKLILNLLEDTEWRTKVLCLKLLSRIIKNNSDLLQTLNTDNLLEDPNYNVQVEILNILSLSSIKIPIGIIFNKLYHTNKEIRAAAIKTIKTYKEKDVDKKFISLLIPLMMDPNSEVRASIFEVFSQIGNFKKLKIPLSPFLDGLTDLNENVRRASIIALEKYFNEEPKLLDFDTILDKIDPNNFEILNSIISLLGKLWKYNPKKILTTLLIFIKFENEQLKENISNILVEKSQENQDLILINLIKIPDTTKFLTKGIISKTIISIAEKDPTNVVQKLVSYLKDENDDIRLNAITSIEGLDEEYIETINIGQVITLLDKDKNNRVKKESSKIISKIAKKDPILIKPLISEIFQAIKNQESSVKITLFKSLLEIAKTSPEIIPVQNIINFLSDEDSFIREISTKILGFVGKNVPVLASNSLINTALIDEEWIVREAAASSLGNIVEYVENKEETIEKLIELLDDKETWVQRTALNILSKIEEVNTSHISIEKLSKNFISKDSNVREASTRLIKIYSNQIEEIFDKIIYLLGDKSKEVRISTVNILVDIIRDVGINKILSKLLQNLSAERSL
ncbi:MAG: MFS transporter, partial [Promethearchaeota archaeon]